MRLANSLLTATAAITMLGGNVPCGNSIPLASQQLMKPSLAILLGALLLSCLALPAFVAAQQPITLGDVEVGLPVITAEEPFAAEYSAAKAAQYLDRSALNWQKTKKCATCHTNLFYLAARPALRTILPDSGEVRSFYEDYLRVRWQQKRPTESQGFWPIVVGTGLTLNDVQTTGQLSDVSREVLDIMWTVQRADGGWKWPDCDYAPLEIDDHYGVTVAALTVGIAPGGYAETPQARGSRKASPVSREQSAQVVAPSRHARLVIDAGRGDRYGPATQSHAGGIARPAT